MNSQERRLDELERVAEMQGRPCDIPEIPEAIRPRFAELMWKSIRRQPVTETERAEWADLCDRYVSKTCDRAITEEFARRVLGNLVAGYSPQDGTPGEAGPAREEGALREIIACLEEEEPHALRR